MRSYEGNVEYDFVPYRRIFYKLVLQNRAVTTTNCRNQFARSLQNIGSGKNKD